MNISLPFDRTWLLGAGSNHPVNHEDLYVNIQNEFQYRRIIMSDQITSTNSEIEEKPDIFHDREKLIHIADNANRISWLFLVFFVVVAVIIGVLLYWYFTKVINLPGLILYSLTALVPFFVSGFFWIASQFISEGVYLLMDIEDNTRRTHNPLATDKQ
jgi:hypothetical protein